MPRKNDVRCRDCLYSLWDLAEQGVSFGCSQGNVPESVMSVKKAELYIVIDCGDARPGERHGGGDGTWNVFDVALGRHRKRPQGRDDDVRPTQVPISPVSRNREEIARIRQTRRDQRHLGDYFEGARRSEECP